MVLHFEMKLSWMFVLAKDGRPGTAQHSSAECDQLSHSSC